MDASRGYPKVSPTFNDQSRNLLVLRHILFFYLYAKSKLHQMVSCLSCGNVFSGPAGGQTWQENWRYWANCLDAFRILASLWTVWLIPTNNVFNRRIALVGVLIPRTHHSANITSKFFLPSYGPRERERER